MPIIPDCSHSRGRRLPPAAALLVMVMAGLAPDASAQSVKPPGGIGGGAGLRPTPQLPPMAPTLTSPTLPTPALPTPVPPPPVAAPQPAAPAAVPAAPAVVRFSCQVDPGAEACKEPPPPDGGGDDEECNCARDYCYDDPAGFRVCQKQ